jgi:hypothetical protein
MNNKIAIMIMEFFMLDNFWFLAAAKLYKPIINHPFIIGPFTEKDWTNSDY